MGIRIQTFVMYVEVVLFLSLSLSWVGFMRWYNYDTELGNINCGIENAAVQ